MILVPPSKSSSCPPSATTPAYPLGWQGAGKPSARRRRQPLAPRSALQWVRCLEHGPSLQQVSDPPHRCRGVLTLRRRP